MTQQQLTPGFYWVRQKFANNRLSIIEIAEGASGVVFVNLLGTTHSPSLGEMVKSFEVVGPVSRTRVGPTESF